MWWLDSNNLWRIKGLCLALFWALHTACNVHNKLDVVSITTPIFQMRKQRFNAKIYSPEDMAEWMKMNSASSSESLSWKKSARKYETGWFNNSRKFYNIDI